jgi:hypothetical protein
MIVRELRSDLQEVTGASQKGEGRERGEGREWRGEEEE